MSDAKPALRAIDLYSGVGGWALGLRMAGVDVVASYDRWGAANETNFKNNRHQAQTVDIRRLELSDLPPNIDIVVGSPPCTQFSFSNRGGNGDIADGLEDIFKFLSIVDHLKPTAWAMENVPRIGPILDEELKPGGRLEAFAHLRISHMVVNMEDYGLPQRRRRCLAGNVDFELLKSYGLKTVKKTLGNVVVALSQDVITDPLYGVVLSKTELHDHEREEFLNIEEVRINRAVKMVHPVYNSMQFPDRLDRSVRTITATCTRVSRESIVIEDLNRHGQYRRLTVRERATLQGFPINFQFYGSGYSDKLRMVGNAIPPVMSFYLALAMLRTNAAELPSLSDSISAFSAPNLVPTHTPPDHPGTRFSRDRTFRFAIPSLRLKSGVRFELLNVFEMGHPGWEVAFVFGTSKSIHNLKLDNDLRVRLMASVNSKCLAGGKIRDELDELITFLRGIDVEHIQDLWSHTGPGTTRPFMLLDRLDDFGERLIEILNSHSEFSRGVIVDAVYAEYGGESAKLKGIEKLLRNAPSIVAGLLLGAAANAELHKHVVISPKDRPQRAPGAS